MAGQIWEGVASAGATVGLQGHWAHLGQPGNMAAGVTGNASPGYRAVASGVPPGPRVVLV